MMRLLFLSLILFVLSSNQTFAKNDINSSIDISKTKENKSVNLKEDILKKQARIDELNKELSSIDNALNRDIYYARYNNHQTYLQISKELESIKKRIKKYRYKSNENELSKLEVKMRSLQNQLDLLDDFKKPPFLDLTKPKDIEKEPVVESPFHLFRAFAYIKQLRAAKDEYKNELNNLNELINKLERKRDIIIAKQNILGKDYREDLLKELNKEIKEIRSYYDISYSTNKIYNKKVDDAIRNVSSLTKEQVKKLINMFIIILFIFILSFIFKYFAKKTITDNQRYYMAHKVINFTNLFLVSLVLLFYFLENAKYLATVLGFASAGIAIAMKDLFMSMLGWFVIVFGGSFHVGDRVKVYKGSKSYVGDIVDISFLRMTILEDVTLTSYEENRRSGRVIFVPNNYVFTELLANYTHGKIKTVWDSINITITFDSNHKKALHIVKEIVKKYSKGYTDISRKQLNLLRNQYSLKNINVDPRVYTFIESSGITISAWYMTNSYATLTLRSNISALIIDEFNKEEDIKIAYDTHILNIKKDYDLSKKLSKGDSEEESLS